MNNSQEEITRGDFNKITWKLKEKFPRDYESTLGSVVSVGPWLDNSQNSTGYVMMTKVTECYSGGHILSRFISEEKASFNFKNGIVLLK